MHSCLDRLRIEGQYAVNLLDLPRREVPKSFLAESNQPLRPLFRRGLRYDEDSASQVQAFVAASELHLKEADRLVAERYGWRGYRVPSIDPCRRDVTGLTGPYLTLLSIASVQTMGTVTLGLDSAAGLFADQLYRDWIDPLRAQGRRVCELVRLAIRPGTNFRIVLDSLLDVAYYFGRVLHGATDLVVEVNPSHVPIYRRLVGFSILGEEKVCPRVGAPSVLLVVSAERLSSALGLAGSS